MSEPAKTNEKPPASFDIYHKGVAAFFVDNDTRHEVVIVCPDERSLKFYADKLGESLDLSKTKPARVATL